MRARTVLVADIGKTTTRLAVWTNGVAFEPALAPGIAGLAADGGTAAAAERLQDCFDRISPRGYDAIAIGVAGAIAAPHAADELAHLLAARWKAPTCVTSDVVTAHLGALSGGAGTILVAGTGAVAWSISDTGEHRLADGRGPELGDLGSGYWIGRAGMRAALRALEGAGAATALAALWRSRQESIPDASASPGDADAIARVAGFARTVLESAAAGDVVAGEIVTLAIDELVATAVSASEPEDPVATLGGLTHDEHFRDLLHDALRAAGRRPQSPAGTALDGAAIAATAAGLPHERLLHRVA